MLYIDFFASKIKSIGKPDGLFHRMCDFTWFDDPIVKEMVQSIDKTTVYSAGQIYSPYLGYITYRQLSTGVKNIILGYKTNYILDASFMGDNCAPWLLWIAERKDIKVTLHHLMHFDTDFKAYSITTDRLITTRKEYLAEFEYAEEHVLPFKDRRTNEG